MSEPKIEVTVQTEDRARAIADLCRGIRICAEALGQNVQVTVQGCTIMNHGKSPGIYIKGSDEPKATKISMTPPQVKERKKRVPKPKP